MRLGNAWTALEFDISYWPRVVGYWVIRHRDLYRGSAVAVAVRRVISSYGNMRELWKIDSSFN